MTEKFCYQCRHKSGDHCLASPMEMSMPDEIAEWLVNGGPKPKVEPRYFHCSVERKHPNGCGPEGKRWEPIPPEK